MDVIVLNVKNVLAELHPSISVQKCSPISGKQRDTILRLIVVDLHDDLIMDDELFFDIETTDCI